MFRITHQVSYSIIFNWKLKTKQNKKTLEFKLKCTYVNVTDFFILRGKLNSGVSPLWAITTSELLDSISDFTKNRHKNDLNPKFSMKQQMISSYRYSYTIIWKVFFFFLPYFNERGKGKDGKKRKGGKEGKRREEKQVSVRDSKSKRTHTCIRLANPLKHCLLTKIFFTKLCRIQSNDLWRSNRK